MAKTVKKKHIWNKPRVRQRSNFVEISERKPLDTTCLYMFPSLAVVGLAIIVFLPKNASMGWSAVGIALASIFGVMSMAVVLVYRPPRVLRLYPFEQVAYRFRRGLHVGPFAKWYDLSEASFEIEQRTAQGDKIESSGQVALGCLAFFFSPLGLISLFVKSQGYEQIPVYCFTHPSSPGQALVVLGDRTDVKRVAELYQLIDEQ